MARKSDRVVLAVDVGNSRTDLAVVDTAEWRVVKRGSVSSAGSGEAMPSAIRKLVGARSRPVPVAVSSVVDGAFDGVEDACRSAGLETVLCVAADDRLPLTVEYDAAGSLGADRLADALYCVCCRPGRTCVIIDAGTAVTVDLITADRRFAGGAILPGPATQLQSLHANTSALPEVPLDSIAALGPGLSTIACMTSGVLSAVVGGIERLVDEFGRDGIDDVVATGGAWPAIAPVMRLEHVHVPEATLLGVAAFAACVQGWVDPASPQSSSKSDRDQPTD